jgi:hypothetical protein
VSEYLRLRQLSTGDLGYLGMEAIPKKMSYLTPSLTLVEEVPETTPATENISYMLKQRANATAASPTTYKMYLRRFNEGTVEQWITLRGKLTEIWTQNAVTGPTDQLATVRSILRGESLTIFNAYIDEHSTYVNAEGVVTNIALTTAGVLAGLHAVAETVFPFRALSNQKLWMRRGMKKPRELSFRKTAAAVVRLNNSLPLFPNATASDMFSDEEIVELLEWSIPQTWRTKFDLDGYVPTSFTKARLITECEILERNEPHKPTKVLPKQKEKPYKKGASPKYKEKYADKKDTFYCTEHGKNPTHNTESCYTIKSRARKATDSTPLTKKSFRREINLLSKRKPKEKAKILEMYAAVLQQERAKTSKQKKAQRTAKKRKQREVATSDTSSSESSSDEEIHVMDSTSFQSKLSKQRATKRAVKPRTKLVVKSKRTKTDATIDMTADVTSDTTSDHESNESPEEKSYKDTIQQLGKPRDEEGESEQTPEVN